MPTKDIPPFTIVPNSLVDDPAISAKLLAVITYLSCEPVKNPNTAGIISKRFKLPFLEAAELVEQLLDLNILTMEGTINV